MKIAIIGSGISGLGAAYLLNPQHDITVFEKNDYVGGHSRTLDIVTDKGPVSVDTGFIVFNHRNYPNLVGLFKHLNVATHKSDMSFAVSIAKGWLEYGTKDTASIFAQRINFLRPAFWRMVMDVFRFQKEALQYLEAQASVTLGTCLDELRMGDWFRRYFILAMGGAIWSCPLSQMLEFPARTFVRFFHNHGLLTVNDQPQWYTVTGGSKEYVKKITASFANRIRLNTPVKAVTKTGTGIEIETGDGAKHAFDRVIFACHADQALSMLKTPSAEQKEILGKVRYQSNHVILHGDTSFMPRIKQCWASWVYLSDARKDESPSMCLSYWMNNLQSLHGHPPIIVTLNPANKPAADKIYNEHIFEHPVFDAGAISAQEQLESIQGIDNMWFCGAWTRYGFHEDGFASGVAVAKKMGASIPWN